MTSSNKRGVCSNDQYFPLDYLTKAEHAMVCTAVKEWCFASDPSHERYSTLCTLVEKLKSSPFRENSGIDADLRALRERLERHNAKQIRDIFADVKPGEGGAAS